MRRMRAVCCARAVNGQDIEDAAAPPANVMNSRRRMESTIQVNAGAEGLDTSMWSLCCLATNAHVVLKQKQTIRAYSAADELRLRQPRRRQQRSRFIKIGRLAIASIQPGTRSTRTSVW